jgi:1,4-dihydroxy-2-naphthoate octaprenyltransferase
MLSSLLHLRFPFSFFLLPVFLFSLSFAPNLNESRLLWVAVILHLLVYPASNGFNSYFDKDEQSIGGLRRPPKVNLSLYVISLTLDATALLLAWMYVSVTFAVMIFIYGLASKAYSHPWIRLKKYPIGGWLITGFFQGFFTFAACYVGLNDFTWDMALRPHVLTAGILSTLLLWGSYPMTQIYQHEEDARRGDISLSLRLGVRGTFYFTALLFLLATSGFIGFFYAKFGMHYVVAFLIALLPILIFFSYWFWRVRADASRADFTHTMALNFISATCLNTFFIYLFLTTTHVLDAV